jgi:hypothetical protein
MPSAPAASRVRRALLIGIDRYRSAPKIPQLDGCVNDVRLMRGILEEQFGFPPEHITLLTDDDATRDAILAALDALVTQTGDDDVVVIHYAGHGSQMTDREGDEASGLDNTIMPVDSEGWSGDNRDITDDELHLRLVALAQKTSYITLIVDACHSATITRDAFGVKSRGVRADTRPASELPPSPVPGHGAGRGVRGVREAGPSGPSGWVPLASQYVLIAGCRDEETSFEYRPPEGEGRIAHGALTYFLSQELRQATSGTSYRDVFERAAARVTANNARQHPQMEGRVDRELFGVADLAPMRFARVLSRTGDTVTLAAGAAHGMTVGSVWAVHPQGAKLADDGDALGSLEITAVRAVQADARVLAEATPGAIGENARAVEREHAYGNLRMPVQLAVGADASPALREALVESRLLEIVGIDEPAAARVYLLEPRPGALPGDPVPQLGALPARTWAVVGDTGELLMPPKPLHAHAEVRANLETLARHRQALALENPSADSALRGSFDLALLRRAADGRWVPAKPDAAGGLPVFGEGEAIAFEVASRHGQRAYVNLLDFGPTGSVSLLFPVPGATDQVEAGVAFEIGTRDGEELTLEFPDNYPFTGGSDAPAEAVETVKLFVTTAEADFRFLEQQGTRSAGGAGAMSPLQLLWQTAAGQAPTRDIKRKRMPVDAEDWTTVVRPFVLRRRSGTALTGSGTPLSLGDATLSAAGLTARVTALPWGTGRADGAGAASDALASALDEAGAEVRQTIEIADARPAAAGARGVGAAQLEVRDPGPDFGQMLMRTDGLGVVTWHFAPVPDGAAGTRGVDAVRHVTRTYSIPTIAGPDDGDGTRGVLGAVLNAAGGAAAKQFLKVVVFPRLDPLVGAVAEDYALRWEAKNRPYAVRPFGPGDYAAPTDARIDAEGWRRLSAGRALLMVHGTFSRAHSAFGAMPPEFVAALHARYGGRVFAFDHFTLSHDPKQNVRELLERLPDGTSLDVDIVCHSRGGLVSRLLAERQGELSMGSRTLRVGRVVFVGTPNAGTTLADTAHMGDFIDTYTTILNLIPSAGVTEVLGGVVTVAKTLAVGAAKGLPGLMSMQPGGEFGAWLNAGDRGAETRYFALSSDFTPSEPGLRAMLKNRMMDRVFGGANDLVVPTDGVFAKNGSGWFPIEDRHVFDGTSGVAHTGFFASRAARDKIMEWLDA